MEAQEQMILQEKEKQNQSYQKVSQNQINSLNMHFL